jgi:hypothetical protein
MTSDILVGQNKTDDIWCRYFSVTGEIGGRIIKKTLSRADQNKAVQGEVFSQN